MSLSTFFLQQVKSNFKFEPTTEQEIALSAITDFLFTQSSDSLFLLKGYAGTGKSSMIGALVRTMTHFQQKTVLMAPTGRAAKVFSGYANQSAFTIHKKIYRQRRFSNDPVGFVPVDNLYKDTLFIVDEASMVSNDGIESHTFGSGRLLDDLIHYVYAGDNCRLMLIGDEAQLPPVKQDASPALNVSILEGYGLSVCTVMMTQTVRQTQTSGILYNATDIRNRLIEGNTEQYPKLSVEGFTDVLRITGEELIDEMNSVYDRSGIENTIVISRSNKRANIYNEGIRNRILYREDEISSGDMLMITKNNYFWTEKIEHIDFLANGELIEVERVRNTQELYGFRFCDITARHPDYEVEIELKILLDTLHSETTSLSNEKSAELFYAILEDYEDVSSKAGKMQKIKSNPYFNAVHVKYGYAVTCHKAQGGEWENVFLDIGYVTEEQLGEPFYRWLYTAITRSKKKLYLVNLPDQFFT